MSSRSILLLGAGGHARACVDVIEQEGRFEIGGFIGLPEQVGERMLGYPVLGVDADLPRLQREHPNALVAVGQIKSPQARERLFELALEIGFRMPLVVSPFAHLSRHAVAGEGTIVMHGAIVNAGATVGRNCIINSMALVEHDCVVADHCHISTAAAINSGVHIGRGTFLGSNACVRQGICIGERCVIGMGQRVLKDCPAGAQLPPARVAE
ncbi:MAG: acetyltransferase [Proteobacteria bacterium]|nr:acetyltransferase [Pseudomonadota bacterium]